MIVVENRSLHNTVLLRKQQNIMLGDSNENQVLKLLLSNTYIPVIYTDNVVWCIFPGRLDPTIILSRSWIPAGSLHSVVSAGCDLV